MDIRKMTDEELATEIIELARQDLKSSTVSKEAQYQALGIIADFTKSKLVKFTRLCVKDSMPTVKEVKSILNDYLGGGLTRNEIDELVNDLLPMPHP